MDHNGAKFQALNCWCHRHIAAAAFHANSRSFRGHFEAPSRRYHSVISIGRLWSQCVKTFQTLIQTFDSKLLLIGELAILADRERNVQKN